MNVVFENQGEIDLRSISTFGISVKENDNPIGYFGTGLKYALAVLLRMGHGVEIHSGEDAYNVVIKEDAVRGKKFSFVFLDDTAYGGTARIPLGFTTELGKNWELWQAYRELACNVMDEKGTIRAQREDVPAVAGTTRVIVTGQKFYETYLTRGSYILESTPVATPGSMEIHPSPSQALYYRGVRVANLDAYAQYTYNLTTQTTLTEDRTVKDMWLANYTVAQQLCKLTDKHMLRIILASGRNSYEGKLDFDNSVDASAEFYEVVEELQHTRLSELSQSALSKWIKNCKKDFDPALHKLTQVQATTLSRAMLFLMDMGYDMQKYDVRVVKSLGPDVLGLAKDGKIFVSQRVFELGGTKMVASTLLEEFIHLDRRVHDCTREMQQILFDKIISMGEDARGEPL